MAPSPAGTLIQHDSQADEQTQAKPGEAARDRSTRWWLDRETITVLLVSVLFTLPLWLGTHPPMADYPQHLSMAAVLRWYHDPARRLAQTYTLEYLRPNTVFVYFVAAMSYVMPIRIAGKLLMAISVAATGLAGLSLARRAGRPGWYASFALISAYDFAFFFGFVNNVIATPLLLYGIVLVDRLLDRPMGWRSWLKIALCGCAFYFVHIQFLFLFVGAVGWLALTRFPGWRNSLWMFSGLVFGVAMTLAHYFLRHEETFTFNEKRIFTTSGGTSSIYDKLGEIPENIFGDRVQGTHLLLFLLATLVGLCLWQTRARAEDALARPAQGTSGGAREGRVVDFLARTRFQTLAAWFVAGYFLMPSAFVGFFIYQRLIAVAWLMLPAVLPVPGTARLRLAKVLMGLTIAVHLVLTAEVACFLDLETRGGHELIAKTQPGMNLMAIPDDISSSVLRHPPPLLHFGAHYMVEKGGRISFSFSELHISMVQLRPGLGFDDFHATVLEWMPWRFRFNDFGYHFDYFLFHGDFAKLPIIFGKHLAHLNFETREDWILLWRKPQSLAAQ
jgi:hypothetical protein